MKYTVDRIEEDFAVCEDENGAMVNIEKTQLPADIREGDIVSVENGEAVILRDETQERRKIISQKRKDIFARKMKRTD
ncbi:MAG: DUF3006 domain-containing protein [Clostridia bacterium]|nr:DUF3006 domain-containing protein [Clostridia bacterium]